MADLEHDIPITTSTVFYIGSVSKQFVTMCVLLLEEEDKLSLGGYRAQMMRFPDNRFSVIILSNLSGFSPTELAYKVANIVLQNELE